LPGKEYRELVVLSVEKGMSRYEIEIALENGEKIEFNYHRAKYDYKNENLNPEGKFLASIHATYYDKDGMPYSGECIANYLDGKWKMTS
jgi:hypothetical protein